MSEPLEDNPTRIRPGSSTLTVARRMIRDRRIQVRAGWALADDPIVKERLAGYIAGLTDALYTLDTAERTK